jgi:hypothetical protein
VWVWLSDTQGTPCVSLQSFVVHPGLSSFCSQNSSSSKEGFLAGEARPGATVLLLLCKVHRLSSGPPFHSELYMVTTSLLSPPLVTPRLTAFIQPEWPSSNKGIAYWGWGWGLASPFLLAQILSHPQKCALLYRQTLQLPWAYHQPQDPAGKGSSSSTSQAI